MYTRSPLTIYTGREPDEYSGRLDNISSANSFGSSKQYLDQRRPNSFGSNKEYHDQRRPNSFGSNKEYHDQRGANSFGSNKEYHDQRGANSFGSNQQYHDQKGIYLHDHRSMMTESDLKRNCFGERYLESGKSSESQTGTVSETDTDNKRPRSYNRVAVRFAERTSVQGIPYINISKTWYAKAAWTLIFLGATGGMIYHLYYLFSIYLSWSVKTNVDLGFDTLSFPAVTICNVNPIMKRRLKIAKQDLRDIVDEVDPEQVSDLYKAIPPPPGSPIGTSGPPSGPPNNNNNNGPPLSRQKRFLDKIPQRPRPPKREETEKKYFEDDDWELVGDYDDSDAVYLDFISLYNQYSREERFQMGHKIDDMLIKCSFSGRSCYAENFTRVSDPHYGNCFTLESRLFKSRRSGPGHGLELILFLENHEYIRGITNSNGAQVMIHERGVLPQPYEDGVAVSGGDETYIGVKLIRVSRLGTPFGMCNDTQEFKEQYGVTYSRSACREVCEAQTTMNECKCSDTRKEEINLKIKRRRQIPGRCSTDDELLCQFKVTKQLESNRLKCDCQDPCQEVKYEKSISSRQWPSDDYAEMLLQLLCHNKGEETCKEFEQSDKRTLSQNFVKVNIYYEDLNYQNITETQDYEFAQFISDVGGTLGLWIGLSVLSVMEVVQFIVELFHHMCCVLPQRKSNMKAQKPYHK